MSGNPYGNANLLPNDAGTIPPLPNSASTTTRTNTNTTLTTTTTTLANNSRTTRNNNARQNAIVNGNANANAGSAFERTVLRATNTSRETWKEPAIEPLGTFDPNESVKVSELFAQIAVRLNQHLKEYPVFKEGGGSDPLSAVTDGWNVSIAGSNSNNGNANSSNGNSVAAANRIKIKAINNADQTLAFHMARIFAQYCMARLCQVFSDHALGTQQLDRKTLSACGADMRRACKALSDASVVEEEEETSDDAKKAEQVLKAVYDKCTTAVQRKTSTFVMPEMKKMSMLALINSVELYSDKIAVYLKVFAKDNDYGNVKVFDNNYVRWESTEASPTTLGPVKRVYTGDGNAMMFDKGYRPTFANGEWNGAQNLFGPHKIPYLGLEYDVIRTLANGYNVTLFGYGHSGSGKSYSLLGEKENNVMGSLEHILKAFGTNCELVSVFEEGPGGNIQINKANPVHAVQYDGQIVWLYSNQTDNQTYRKTETSHKAFEYAHQTVVQTSVSDRRGELVEQAKKLNNKSAESIIKFITEDVSKVRRDGLRMRATINNPRSSRTHLYLVFEVRCGKDHGRTARFTLADLGGIEDPHFMLLQAFKRLDGWKDGDANESVSMKIGGKETQTTAREFVKQKLFFSQGVREKRSSHLTCIDMMVTFITTLKKVQFNYGIGTTIAATFYNATLSDWVKGYATAYRRAKETGQVNKEMINQAKVLAGSEQLSDRCAAQILHQHASGANVLDLNPASDRWNVYPPTVMMPKAGTSSNPKPLFMPDGMLLENSDLNYFSMMHVAALYIEGLYIQESLRALRTYMSNGRTHTPGAYQESVLTGSILNTLDTKPLSSGAAPLCTRYVMLYTMNPRKLTGDYESMSRRNNASIQGASEELEKFVQTVNVDPAVLFVEPTNFINSICSTVSEDEQQS